MNNQALMKEYRARINRVEDYIQENIESELSLDELAEVAAFSKYHFGRIFAMMTGETLFQYIQRMRVEKSASLLLTNPALSITETAFSCGFSSLQAFSRAFGRRFGVSASQWRELGGQTPEIVGRIKAGRVKGAAGEFPNSGGGLQPDPEIVPGSIEVVETRDIEVIYIRYVGPFQGDTELFAGLFGKLNRWAAARSLIGPNTRSFCIVHDNPAITDDRRIRLSCCLSVKEEVRPDGEIGRMKIRGGRYARFSFTIDDRQYGQAWSWLYTQWLPSSGYQPDEKPAFEEYLTDQQEMEDGTSAGELKHKVLLWLPVRPL